MKGHMPNSPSTRKLCDVVWDVSCIFMEREHTMRPVIQIFRLLTVNEVRIGFEGSTDLRGEAYNAKRGLWGNWNGISLLISAKSDEQTFERETQSTPITGNLEAVEERSNVKAHVE